MKPTFKLGNKTDKFSFFLPDQLQRLFNRNKLCIKEKKFCTERVTRQDDFYVSLQLVNLQN